MVTYADSPSKIFTSQYQINFFIAHSIKFESSNMISWNFLKGRVNGKMATVLFFAGTYNSHTIRCDRNRTIYRNYLLWIIRVLKKVVVPFHEILIINSRSSG